MKKIFTGIILFAFLGLCVNSAQKAYAEENQMGLGGLYLFIELRTDSRSTEREEKFHALVDLEEVSKQPYQLDGKKGPPRRICEDKIGGIDYSLWIEPGRNPETNYFWLSVIQEKDALGLGGFSANLSPEAGRYYNGIRIFAGSSGSPIFTVRVYAATDASTFKLLGKKLNCFYPLYNYPKASK